MAKVKKVSVFNPFKNAFCEVDIETAKKFVEEGKKTEKVLNKLVQEEKNG